MVKSVSSILKAGGKFLWENKFNTALSLWGGVSQYQDAREEGASRLGAAAESAADLALPFILSLPGYLAYEAATGLPGAVVNGVDALDKRRRTIARESSTAAFNNAKFNDNEQVFTMRQAGMAAAQRSKYNTQLAMLGQEAKYMMK